MNKRLPQEKLVTIKGSVETLNQNSQVFEEVDKILAHHFEASEDIIAIYDYGNRTHPGISDVDLILVCVDKPANSASLNNTVASLEADLDSVQARNSATIMTLHRRFFVDLPRIDCPDLHRLFGPDIAQRAADSREQFFRDATNLLEWVAWNHFKYAAMLLENALEPAAAMRFLKCMAYTLDNIDVFLKNENTAYVTIAKHFRDNWIKGESNNSQLALYLHEFMQRILSATTSLSESLAPQLCKENTPLPDLKTPNFLPRKFSSTPPFALNNPLPPLFALSWQCYAAKGPSRLASNIASVVGGQKEAAAFTHPEYASYLAERFTLIQQHVDFIDRYLPAGGAFKLGWFRG